MWPVKMPDFVFGYMILLKNIVNKRTTSITNTSRQCNFWKKKQMTKDFQRKYSSEFMYESFKTLILKSPQIYDG